MTQKVFILEIGGVIKARPAYAAAAPSETVRFVNLTAQAVTLNFVDQWPFKESTPIVLSGQGAKENRVVKDDLADGRYPYLGTPAVEGESNPEIIIDR